MTKKTAKKKTAAKPKAATRTKKKVAGSKAGTKKAKATPKRASQKTAKSTKTVKKAAPKKAAKKSSTRKAATKTAKSTETKRKKAVTAEPVPPKAALKSGTKGLSDKQIEHFRQKLLSEKQRVLEEMGEIASSTLKKSISDQSGENSRYSYHLGDVASLSYGREFSMGLAERQQKYLEQIDDALQRIEDGTYGICKVTGELIPVERLEEVPIAKYSVRGKELLEQQRRHGYDERRMQGPGVTDEQRRAYELITRRPLSPRS
ncbi:MAG: hypothetical protein GF331_01215 [Chitinivibrionales bacterium]|nr:hypothetical protein [Chitinivibrionales bacterium]